MAIKIPGRATATATSTGETVEIPNDIPRHGGDGRPKIRIGSSAKFAHYSRASSYGKTLADTYNLDRWDKRVVVFGLSRDRSLLLAAQAVPAFEDKTDEVKHREYRAELDRIVDAAREVAKSDRAAMRGTALHVLSEQADAGADLSHLDATTTAALAQWRRFMSMFRIVATETFVVHDGWQVGGSFDRLVELLVEVTIRDGDGEILAVLPAGTRVVVDLKSGASSAYFGMEYATQLATYAGGCPYVHLDDAAAAAGNNGKGDDGRRPWPDGVAPSQDWALIPHVPVDKPEDAGLLWVDLSVGRTCGDLVALVKDARRAAKGAYHAGEVVEVPGVTPPAALPARQVDEDVEGFVEVMLELIGSAVDEAALGQLYERHAADWLPVFTDAAGRRVEELRTGRPVRLLGMCAECVDGEEDPRPWCECESGEQCKGPCRQRAHDPAVHEEHGGPGVAPAEPAPVTQVQVVEQLRAAATIADLGALYEQHAAVWTPYLGEVASARADELAAAQPVGVGS